MLRGIIFCGGKGTRMGYISEFIPKALLPLGQQSILDYCIKELLELKIEEIIIVIQRTNNSAVIEDYINKRYIETNFYSIGQIRIECIEDSKSVVNSFCNLNLDLQDTYMVHADEVVSPRISKQIIQASQYYEVPSVGTFFTNIHEGLYKVKCLEKIERNETESNIKTSNKIIGRYMFSAGVLGKILSDMEISQAEDIIDLLKIYLSKNDFLLSYHFKDRYLDLGSIAKYSPKVEFDSDFHL
jgi:NDP-sugar pyrophosphorylase family protein